MTQTYGNSIVFLFNKIIVCVFVSMCLFSSCLFVLYGFITWTKPIDWLIDWLWFVVMR